MSTRFPYSARWDDCRHLQRASAASIRAVVALRYDVVDSGGERPCGQAMEPLRINKSYSVDPDALSWTAARASGPGGQHVNKTSSKVELTFDPAVAELPVRVLRRLRARIPGHFDQGGLVHIVSQKTRSQARNLDDARERLAELLREVWPEPKRRKATRPTRSSVRRRLDGKRKKSEKKKLRGRVRRDGD